MATLTTAQRRALQLEKFNNDYVKDIEKAKYIVNSYYRLCGLSERNCINANDSDYYKRFYDELKKSEEKEQKWISRLNAHLKPYNLSIVYPGIYPEIAIVDHENGCVESVVVDYIPY